MRTSSTSSAGEHRGEGHSQQQGQHVGVLREDQPSFAILLTSCARTQRATLSFAVNQHLRIWHAAMEQASTVHGSCSQRTLVNTSPKAAAQALRLPARRLACMLAIRPIACRHVKGHRASTAVNTGCVRD